MEYQIDSKTASATDSVLQREQLKKVSKKQKTRKKKQKQKRNIMFNLHGYEYSFLFISTPLTSVRLPMSLSQRMFVLTQSPNTINQLPKIYNQSQMNVNGIAVSRHRER